MKRFLSVMLAAVVALTMVSLAVSCKQPEEVTLSSIAVTTQPTKTSYTVGETLDTTGMVVTATYSDATTKDVTSSVKTSGFDSSAVVTSQEVTVSYTEGDVTKTATFTIAVSDGVLQAQTTTTVKASGWTAWLGGEATQVTLTSATVGGVEKVTDPVYIGTSYTDGTYALTWNDYDSFYGLADLGDTDFTLKYTFTEKSVGANNWNNWAFMLTDGTNGTWYLRSDNWSNSTMSTYSNVSYKNTYTWDSFYKNNFEGKTLTLTVVKTDASIVATLNNGTEDIYTVTATPPTSTYTIGVGGESCYIDISSIKVNSTEKLTANQTIGTDNGDGTYTLAYAQDVQKLEGLSLTDEWTVVYTFTQKSAYASNYHSYNFKITNGSDSTSWTVRCDNYGWGKLTGYTDYEADHWSGMTFNGVWTDATAGTTFASNFDDCTLTMTIKKTASSIIMTLNNGTKDIWTCTNAATN